MVCGVRTWIDFIKAFVIFERFVVQRQVNVDGTVSRPLVEPMRPQNVLQPQEVNVRTEGHLTHAVRVEVELILDDLTEMLKTEKSSKLKFYFIIYQLLQ